MRWSLAAASLALMTGAGAVAHATQCEADTAGTGLAFPVSGTKALEPAATEVQLLALDVSLTRKGTSAKYELANPGDARVLAFAIPIFAAQDEDQECEPVAVRASELSLLVDGGKAVGAITPVAADTALAEGSPRFDAVFVAQIPFAKGQRRVVDVNFNTALRRSDAPSSYGQHNTVVRWPMRHLDMWSGATIPAMSWRVAVGAANHCLAIAEWGSARFDSDSGEVIAGPRKVKASDPIAKVGVYVEWETGVDWDEVYLARGDYAEALAPIVEALEAGKGVTAATSSLPLDALELAYEGFFESYASRNALDTANRELLCQEVDVASFLEAVAENVRTNADTVLASQWLQRRPPRPLALSGFSKTGRRVMKALKAELDRRHVKSRPLPPK
jgi:hypothetical protein